MIVFGIPTKELKIFLERLLNEREKELLLMIGNYKGVTFSTIVKNLSNRYPQSTIKLVLKRLKNFNLVDFGDFKDKGKPMSFTILGEKISKVLGDVASVYE